MITVNNSPMNLLECQQETQIDITHALQAMQESKRDHANDTSIDDKPTSDDKPELDFNWILKLENIAEVTKQNPKESVLGDNQGAVMKCLKPLPEGTS